MISIINPTELDYVLRPTVYLPAGDRIEAIGRVLELRDEQELRVRRAVEHAPGAEAPELSACA